MFLLKKSTELNSKQKSFIKMSKKDAILTAICKFLSQLISPGRNNSHDIAIFHVSSLASVPNQSSKFSI